MSPSRTSQQTRRVLLFDSDCVPCSQVAYRVRELCASRLEIMSLRDPSLAELLGDADLNTPDRPSLLIVTDNGRADVVYGWALRSHLAKLVGWRRAQAIMRLLVSEWRARLARDANGKIGLARRRVVGSAMAGVVGWALLPRSAGGRTPGQDANCAPAAEADVKRALATNPVRRAIQTWGPTKPTVMEVRDGAERILAFSQGEGKSEIVTFVDNSADARHGSPIAISLGNSPSKEKAIRFYTVDGVPLCDIAGQGDSSVVLPLYRQSETETIEPDFNVECWLGCMTGIPLPFNCFESCVQCFGLIGAPINCTYCLACAGPRAFTCAKKC